MQEEINQKTISLCVKGGRISASLLKAAMKKFLADMEKRKQKSAQNRQAEGKKKDVTVHGKQSLKKLMRQGSQLTAAANPFAFGEFEVYEGRSSYTVVKASISNYFRQLVEDFENVYYGFYWRSQIIIPGKIPTKYIC